MFPALVFVASNVALIWCSARLAAFLCAGAERWRRAVAIAGLFPTLIVLVLLPLGATGHFTASAQLIGSLVVLIATEGLLVVGRRVLTAGPQYPPQRVNHHRHETTARAPRPAGTDAGGTLAVGVALVLCALSWEAVFLRVDAPQPRYDDFTYHAPAVFEWLSRRSFELAPILDYHAYFPFNGELIAAWFLRPYGTDSLYELAGLTWSVVGAVAVYGLSRACGAKSPLALLAVATFISGKGVAVEAQSFAAADVALAAMLLCTTAMLLPPASGRARPKTWIVLGGAFAGVAFGIKVSALPVVALLVLACIWAEHRRGWASVVRAIAVFGIAFLALGGYWYGRTWVLTGNPLYPAALGPFDGPFDQASQDATKLAHWVLSGPGVANRLILVLTRYAYWGGLLVLVPVSGLALAIARLLTDPRDPRRPQKLLIVAVASIALLAFPLLPFSGTPNEPSGWLRVALRFVLLPYALGCISFAASARGPVAITLLVGGLVSAEREGTVFGTLLTPVLVVGAWGLWRRLRPPLSATPKPGRSWRPAASLAGLVAGIGVILATAQPMLQARVDRTALTTSRLGVPLGKAWGWVDALPRGARVAAYGSFSDHVLGLYGRRLQHDPAAVSESGRLLPPQLHELWARTRTGGWWASDPADPNLGSLVDNLRAAGVQYVLLLRRKGTGWPIQRAALATSHGPRRLRASRRAELWKIPE